eukprot:scaffold593_cov382-Prasinococcus_capsulatus_cf.AAC.34
MAAQTLPRLVEVFPSQQKQARRPRGIATGYLGCGDLCTVTRDSPRRGIQSQPGPWRGALFVAHGGDTERLHIRWR